MNVDPMHSIQDPKYDTGPLYRLLPPPLIVMSSVIQKSHDLPNEIWLHILKLAVDATEWPTYAFFPPADDLACLRGFKAASRRFCDLAECAERSGQRRSVFVRHPKDLLEGSLVPEHVRHLMVEEDALRLTLDKWSILAPRFVNLESLSIRCCDNSVLDCLHATSLAKRLRRLDLTCVDMYLSALDLDFPNLLELRLSTVRPTTRTTRAEDFLLETMGFSLLSFDFDVMSTVFVEMLGDSLHKLRSLQLLSMHVALVPLQQFNYARLHHNDRHESEQCDFRVCKLCPQLNELPEILNREATASTSLAKVLPKLERVRWTDPWKTVYFDEDCQREYTIARGGDAGVRAILRLKPSIAPLRSSFAIYYAESL